MNQASIEQPDKAGNKPKQNAIPRSLAFQNNAKLIAKPKRVYKKALYLQPNPPIFIRSFTTAF